MTSTSSSSGCWRWKTRYGPRCRRPSPNAATAGIRVVMMTGDHPATALSVAHQVGLGGDGALISGAELAGLDDDQLQARLADTQVFCRVQPEQKRRNWFALSARAATWWP